MNLTTLQKLDKPTWSVFRYGHASAHIPIVNSNQRGKSKQGKRHEWRRTEQERNSTMHKNGEKYYDSKFSQCLIAWQNAEEQ